MKIQDGLSDMIRDARQDALGLGSPAAVPPIGHEDSAARARFVPVVYHGGENLGLGRWATGHHHATLERAEREAARLERQYKQQYGTAVIIEIEIVH